MLRFLKSLAILLVMGVIIASCQTMAPVTSAIASGDVSELKRLMADPKFDPNANDALRSAVSAASSDSKYTDFVRLLIERGADVGKADKGLVRFAIEQDEWNRQHGTGRNSEVLVPLLIQHGANVDKVGSDGKTALQVAVENNWPHQVLLLLKNQASARGADLFQYGLERANLSLIERCLQAGFDLNALLPSGLLPLQIAFRAANTESTEFLIQKGARIDTPTRDGQSLLGYSLDIDQIDDARLLVKLGAQTASLKDKSGRSPLVAAVESGKADKLAFYLELGLSLDGLKSSSGGALLPEAVVHGFYDVARTLVKAGAEPDAKDSRGTTALAAALAAAQNELAADLVEFGASLDPLPLQVRQDISSYRIDVNRALAQAALEADASKIQETLARGASIAGSGAKGILSGARLPETWLARVHDLEGLIRQNASNIDQLKRKIDQGNQNIRFWGTPQWKGDNRTVIWVRNTNEDIQRWQIDVRKLEDAIRGQQADLKSTNDQISQTWSTQKKKAQAVLDAGETPAVAAAIGKDALNSLRTKYGEEGLLIYFRSRKGTRPPQDIRYDLALRWGWPGLGIAQAYGEGTEAIMQTMGPSLIALVLRAGPEALTQGKPKAPPLPVAEVVVERRVGLAERPVVHITVTNKGKGEVFDLRANVSCQGVVMPKDRATLAIGAVPPGTSRTVTFVAPPVTVANLLAGDLPFKVTFSELNDNVPRDGTALVNISPPSVQRISELAKRGILSSDNLVTLVVKGIVPRSESLILLKNGDLQQWVDALLALKLKDSEAEEVMTARRETLSSRQFLALAAAYNLSGSFYTNYLDAHQDFSAPDVELFVSRKKISTVALQKNVLTRGDRWNPETLVGLAKKGLVTRETLDRVVRGKVRKFTASQLLALFQSSSISSSVVAYEIENREISATKAEVLALAQAGCLGRSSMNRLVRDRQVVFSIDEVFALQKAGKLDRVALGYSARVVNDENATIPGPGDGLARLGAPFDFVIKFNNASIFSLRKSTVTLTANDKDVTLFNNTLSLASLSPDESVTFVAQVQPTRKFVKEAVSLKVRLDNPDFGTLVLKDEVVPLFTQEPEVVISLAETILTKTESVLRTGASEGASVLANLSAGVSLKATGKTSAFYRVESPLQKEPTWISIKAVSAAAETSTGSLALKSSVSTAWEPASYAVEALTGLKPEIEILSPVSASVVQSDKALVTVRASDRSSGIGAIRLEVNGKPVADSALRRGLSVIENPFDMTRTFEVKLIPGPNEITAVAVNKRLESSYPVTVTAQSRPIPQGGSLWVLAIGLSDYKDATQRLGLAAGDAKSFASLFSAQKGSLYSSVNVRTLTDAQATRETILAGINDFLGTAEEKDTVLFFYAGHGIVGSDGLYYLVPWDAVMNNQVSLSSRGLSREDLAQAFSRDVLAEKTFLFLDSCQSGTIAKRSINSDSEISKLQQGFGKFIMTASRGTESALEDPAWGNGAMTKAIKEALGDGKADYDELGSVSVYELMMYVADRVASLTGDRQHPNTQNAFVEPIAFFQTGQ